MSTAEAVHEMGEAHFLVDLTSYSSSTRCISDQVSVDGRLELL